jgi:hypothetical protein
MRGTVRIATRNRLQPPQQAGNMCRYENGGEREQDALPDKVHVNLCGVLLQLSQDLLNVAFVRQPDHHIQLLQLDVDRVIVLDKKYLRLSRDFGT